MTQNLSAKPAFIIVSEARNGERTLSIENLTLSIPNGGPTLVQDFSLILEPGQSLILTGPSGSGKSTLAKAVRNLWDNGSGRITLPANAKIMFVSQKIVIPNTSLSGILNAPKLEGHFDDSDLTAALDQVGLSKLIQHIPGQQVRIMMDDLLAQIQALPDKSAMTADNARRDIFPLVSSLVEAQFDYVQYVPQKQADYLRNKLGDIVPRQEADTLANLIVAEMNRHLVRPLYDHLTSALPDQIPAPASAVKARFLTWSVHRKLLSKLDDYRANRDTDNPARPIKINAAQAAHIAAALTEKLEQDIQQKRLQKGTLKALFSFVSLPLSLRNVSKKADILTRDTIQKLTKFMDTQHVTGDLLATQLSGGEQNKLMLARVRLHRPPILILDENTAALDVEAGDRLYGETMKSLPVDTIVISIAHNPHIIKHHTHHAHLDPATKTITVKPIVPGAPKPPG